MATLAEHVSMLCVFFDQIMETLWTSVSSSINAMTLKTGNVTVLKVVRALRLFRKGGVLELVVRYPPLANECQGRG